MILQRLFGEGRNVGRRLALGAGGGTAADPDATFDPEECYFQIGIAQVHIRNLSFFLKEFAPLIYSQLSYQLGARRSSTTFVIDPRQDTSGARGRGILRYQPIISPVPFLNHDIQLRIALLRVQTADFAPAVIRLLSSVASTAMPDFKMAERVATLLNNGVNDLLKDATSFIVGLSETHSPASPLAPGYVLVATDGAMPADQLLVIDDVLHVGDDCDTAIPYERSDFILYRVDRIESRNDYLVVEPIASIYEKAIRMINAGHVDGLNEAFGELKRAVMTAPEFTLADAKRILVALKSDLQDRWEAQKADNAPFKSLGSDEPPPLRVVSEGELEAAMAWSPTARSAA